MSKKLFTPGPGNIPQFVRVQLSKDIIHHRMSDYQNLLYRVTEKLQQVFMTKNDVLILTSSGTGAMESSVVNLFSKGDEVLIINTGFFGVRFIEICQTYQLTVHSIDYNWGDTYNLQDVKDMFDKYPHIKGVFVTYHETSTGVLNDIKELGQYIHTKNALLIADCISGMIIHPFEFDLWNVDCALASSQKGFLLPPGLAFVALSKKAKEVMKHSNLPKFYWNYQKYLDYFKKGQNPYTPSTSLILALDIVLDAILEKGIECIAIEKMTLRKYVEEKMEEIGFKLFIEDEKIKGNALVPVLANNNYDIEKLVQFLDNRYDFSVAKGQGKLTNLMLRIGIISEFTFEDIDDLVNKILEFKAIEDNNITNN
ncbi:alanine--glyoxylate aminotransferase family protein [Mycoplasmatota bacterium]|nr:alanine--glyoxylate aminotransferase family protein [Mycoplasmatota bacterium]